MVRMGFIQSAVEYLFRRSPADTTITNTAAFFQLPRDIQLSVLLEWLPFAKEYSQLDVAMCSHCDRKHWLALLGNPDLRVDLAFESAPGPGYWSWLVKRCLHTPTLHVDASACEYYSFGYYPFPQPISTVVLMGSSRSEYSLSSCLEGLKWLPSLTKLTTHLFAGSLGNRCLKTLAKLDVPLKVLEVVDTDAATRTDSLPYRSCVFQLISLFGKSLEVLHLNIASTPDGGPPDTELLVRIRSRCPLLRAIRLPGVSFHYHHILDLSSSHPWLTALECKIDFSRCIIRKPFDVACVTIMSHFPDLQHLAVLGCGHSVKADSLPLDQHPKLKVFATDQLCVDQSVGNSSFVIHSCTEEADAQLVCQLLLGLESAVKTIACSGPAALTSIDNALLLAIAAKHGSALERWINFHFAANLDDVTLEQFLTLCPRIKVLYIPSSPPLTCDAVVHVANHCRHLVTLIMTIPDVTDAAACALLTRCTKLKKLCLPGSLLTAAVFEHCSQLTMLGFSSSQLKITVNEMISAIEGGKLSKLRVLKIRQSTMLQYVSAAVKMAAAAGSKLAVEEFKHSRDFL